MVWPDGMETLNIIAVVLNIAPEFGHRVAKGWDQ